MRKRDDKRKKRKTKREEGRSFTNRVNEKERKKNWSTLVLTFDRMSGNCRHRRRKKKKIFLAQFSE